MNIKQIKLLRLYKETLVDKEYHEETIEFTEENMNDATQILHELDNDETVVAFKIINHDGSVEKIKRYNNFLDGEW